MVALPKPTVREFLVSRNIMQLICLLIAVSFPVFWTVIIEVTFFELLIVLKTFEPRLWLMWAIGFIGIGPISFFFYWLARANWSWVAFRNVIKEIPELVRFLVGLLIASWAFSKLMLFIHDELRFLSIMDWTVYLSELDILLPFGVVGALMLVFQRRHTQNLIVAIKSATPEERQQLYQILQDLNRDYDSSNKANT